MRMKRENGGSVKGEGGMRMEGEVKNGEGKGEIKRGVWVEDRDENRGEHRYKRGSEK